MQCLNWKQRSTSAGNDFKEPVDMACNSSFTERGGVCHYQFFARIVLLLTAPLQTRPESCSALRELHKRSLSFMYVNVHSLHLTL